MKNFLLLSIVITLAACHIQTEIRNGNVKAKGVNLGGWLLVEHWMTSSSVVWDGVPEYYHSYGEYGLMQYWGHGNGDWRFEQHRSSWITENDIAEIASRGLNTVRVPIGYWIAGFDNQDPSGSQAWKTFAPGAINYLDQLIKNWALNHNVAVLISIHGAKGSQNGNDHSAPPVPGQSYWAQYPENVQNTVDLAAWLADRYRWEPAFLGIGLLNEPSGSTDETTLKNYYNQVIGQIRNTGNDCVLVTAPLLYNQDPDHFQDFARQWIHIWHDWHKYLVWGYEGQNEWQILNEAIPGVQNQINNWWGNSLFIGEWSLATNGDAPFNSEDSFREFGNKYRDTISSSSGGWTYWSWKASWDENAGNIWEKNTWSLRQLLRHGWFNL